MIAEDGSNIASILSYNNYKVPIVTVNQPFVLILIE